MYVYDQYTFYVALLTLKHKQTIETSTNVLITFYVDPVSLRGRHVCTIIPNCASTCDVSEFFDAEIPNAYCRRCSILFLKMKARLVSDAGSRCLIA